MCHSLSDLYVNYETALVCSQNRVLQVYKIFFWSCDCLHLLLRAGGDFEADGHVVQGFSFKSTLFLHF